MTITFVASRDVGCVSAMFATRLIKYFKGQLVFERLKNMRNNTKIYYKLYLLTKYFYDMVKNFPKEYKYSLGRDILSLSWRCLDLSLEANRSANNDKKDKIWILVDTFEKLKMRLRMSREIKLISIGQSAHLEECFMAEIGRMIGGWQKWANNALLKQKELSSRLV